MRFKTNQQLSVKILIIYMISTLAFLSSIELHIHTQDAAVSADHNLAVSFSTLSNDIGNIDNADEITVSPDGMLKVHYNAPDMLAVFLLLALIVAISIHISVSRKRESHSFTELPFFGTPALRAPPQ